jgi:hypothetical protein
MELRPIDAYFEQQEEPVRSCLQYLRTLIQQHDAGITEAWKYRMPFYCYGNKMCCYLWVHKKYRQPYIGIVDGGLMDYPELLTEKRSRMKILLIDPDIDIPATLIRDILDKALQLAVLR